jgi:hypothetical protein
MYEKYVKHFMLVKKPKFFIDSDGGNLVLIFIHVLVLIDTLISTVVVMIFYLRLYPYSYRTCTPKKYAQYTSKILKTVTSG